MNISLPRPQRIAIVVLSSFGLLPQERSSAVKQRSISECPTLPYSSPIPIKRENPPIAIAIFFHHRDVKVALEELQNRGIPLAWITLIARDSHRFQWLPGIKICDRFEETSYQQFFWRYFKKGNYLITVRGTEDAIQCATAILSRRRKHAKVWQL